MRKISSNASQNKEKKEEALEADKATLVRKMKSETDLTIAKVVIVTRRTVANGYLAKKLLFKRINTRIPIYSIVNNMYQFRIVLSVLQAEIFL